MWLFIVWVVWVFLWGSGQGIRFSALCFWFFPSLSWCILWSKEEEASMGSGTMLVSLMAFWGVRIVDAGVTATRSFGSVEFSISLRWIALGEGVIAPALVSRRVSFSFSVCKRNWTRSRREFFDTFFRFWTVRVFVSLLPPSRDSLSWEGERILPLTQ